MSRMIKHSYLADQVVLSLDRKQALIQESGYHLAIKVSAIKLHLGENFIIPPRNEVRGGILESPCPSVRLSVRLSSAFGFPAHNCFPFTPIIMKLHMQTPHEARMCPIDFEVKGQKVKGQGHNA